MTDIVDWIDSVQRIVPGVDETLLVETVREALIQLSEETNIHSHVFVEPSTVDGTHTYTMTFPTDTILKEIVDAWYDGNPIDLWDVDDLQDDMADWDTREGNVSRFIIVDVTDIRLVGIPTADDKILRVSMYVRPAEGAATVDDRYWREHKDTITYLAASLLLSMPKSPDRPWGNASSANTYQARYAEKLSRVLSDGTRNQHTRKRRRAKPW